MPQQNILLSICIPAYNRPVWFRRALKSIIDNTDNSRNLIEVIVSDDSDNDECSIITQETLTTSNITYRYEHNQPKLGMAANWNNSIQLASGKYVLVLHDDDFLLNNGINKIIKAIRNNQEEYPVILLGVYVVNEQEKVIKKQLFKRKLYLPPEKALLKVLSNSSFIRFPGIVIRRDVLEQVGYFDTEIGEIADLDMWIRLLSKHGLLCLPNVVSAYTVHTNALTTKMFNEATINQLLGLFNGIEKLNILNSQQIAKCQSDFIHQFILAGTYREIKSGNFKKALDNINLFTLPCLNQLPTSIKWFWLRLLFRLALA